MFSPTFDYEDDFDSETPREDASSTSSSHSATPTTSLKDDLTKSNNTEAAATSITPKDVKALVTSAAAEDRAQNHVTTLLSRSGNKQSLLHREQPNAASQFTAALRSSENGDFKLSPICTHLPQTGLGLANKSVESVGSSSILSSESNSSISHGKGSVTLTPLHTKQLTANDMFRSSSTDKRKGVSERKQVQTTPPTLSPLHAMGGVVERQCTNEFLSPDKGVLKVDERPQTIGLSPVDASNTKSTSNRDRQLRDGNEVDQSSPTHKQMIHLATTNHQRQQKREQRTTKLQMTGGSSLPKDVVTILSEQSKGVDSVERDTSQKHKEESLLTELSRGGESGLGDDLAELQSALQAAGLPPMDMEEERQTENGGEEEDLRSPLKEYPSSDDSTEQPDLSPPSAKDSDKEPVKLASLSGDISVPSEGHPSVSTKPTSQRVAGVDLREAIRAIASEELTSISKEIMKQGIQHKNTQQPLHINNDTQSCSGRVDKRPDQSRESSLPRGEGDRSQQPSYRGLELLGDLLDDIHVECSGSQKSTSAASKKPGMSSSRKSASNLPKMSTKPVSSKKGPSASKVDSGLTNKTKPSAAVSSKLLSTKKDSQRDKSGSSKITAPVKGNRAPSATVIGTKPKTPSQIVRPSTSSAKSAPLKQLSNGRTNLKRVSKSTSKTTRPARRDIVIPTGSSTALDSDSEDEIIHAVHEPKKREERPEVKIDAWKKALQEEKVHKILPFLLHSFCIL